MNHESPPRHQLRQHYRARRRALGGCQQHQAAAALARRVASQPFYRRAMHIAGYLPNDGEISPLPLLHAAQRSGKCIYLPLLATGKTLLFMRYRPGLTPLRRNRLGILEPYFRSEDLIPPERLDLALLPLVAFDIEGNRLGMGGGFYDRTLAFLTHRQRWRKPYLLGTAYQFQQFKKLPTQPWDIPLGAIVTEQGVIQV